jgi:hypothetical protein
VVVHIGTVGLGLVGYVLGQGIDNRGSDEEYF